MDKNNPIVIIDLPDGQQDIAIQIERTPEFTEVAKILSNHIKGLSLTHADNDRLVALMIENVQAAERGAFAQGFSMGREYGQYEKEGK